MERGCLDISPKWDLPYLSVGFSHESHPAKSMELLAVQSLQLSVLGLEVEMASG